MSSTFIARPRASSSKWMAKHITEATNRSATQRETYGARSQGLRVLRIPAALVMNDLDSVSRGIMTVCHEQTSEFPSTTR